MPVALDEQSIRSLPMEERLDALTDILMTDDDESVRWDAVWLTGEIAVEAGLKGPLYERVADLFSHVLKEDPNCVVRHEVCYQISGRNMTHKADDLADASLYDPSPLVRHEAVECLGILHAYDYEDTIKKVLEDPEPAVSDTAKFVLKRLDRLKEQGSPPPNNTDTSSF